MLAGIDRSIRSAVAERDRSQAQCSLDTSRDSLGLRVRHGHAHGGLAVGKSNRMRDGVAGVQRVEFGHRLIVVTEVRLTGVVAPSRFERTSGDRCGFAPRTSAVVTVGVGDFC